MDYAIRGQRKHWWNSKTFRITMTAIGAALISIPFTNIAGFFGLWLVVAGTSFIIIRILFPSDKRTFPLFCWQIGVVSFLCAVLFYESASTRVASGKLDWFGNILIGSTAGRLIGSIILGLLLGAPIVILPTLFRAYSGVIWVLALDRIYGISRWQALRLTLSLILNVQRPIILIEEGQIKEVKPEGWPVSVGGPALVLIRPYNAVVLEQAGRVTRIEGPGTVLMGLEERIKDTVDLRRQSAGFEAEQVLTRDRVPLRVKGGVGFRIQQLEDRVRPADVARMRDLNEKAFPIAGRDTARPNHDAAHVLRKTVYNAVYGPRTGQKWYDRMKGDVESEMRKAFRTYNFDEIYDPNGRVKTENGARITILDDIAQAVRDALRAPAESYGVHVFGASISTIQIDQAEAMQSAYFAALVSEWRSRAQLTQANADRKTLTKRANAQSQIVVQQIGAVLQEFRTALANTSSPDQQPISPEVIDRFLQVSSRLLENVIIDRSAARQYLDTMESLARVSPTTIIAAGMDVSQVADVLASGITTAQR